MPVGRRYHVQVNGALYAGVTLLLGVGAINSQNNLLYLAFGLAIGGLLVSGLVSGAMLTGLRVERQEIESGAVGEVLVARYRVTNRNRLVPIFALVIEETSGGDGTWERLMRAPRGGAVHVGPGQSIWVDAPCAPSRRGEAVFERYRATTSFPFGIVRKSVLFRQRARAIVRPEPAAVDREAVRRAASRAERDASVDTRVGRGLDYIGLREYHPGDSLRRIAWRASARTGELVVREETRPSAGRLWVELELTPLRAGSDGDDDGDPVVRANERAISVAAGMVIEAARAGVAVGLVVPAVGVRREPADAQPGARGEPPARVGLLLDDLALIDLRMVGRAGVAPSAPRERAVAVIRAGAEAEVWEREEVGP